MKFQKHSEIAGALIVCTAVFTFMSIAPGAEAAATFKAGTYKELHGQLTRLNPADIDHDGVTVLIPEGEDYAAYKDIPVTIELTGDLDVNDLGSALKATSDSDTGATLRIARPDITIDGGGRTITARGYPTFNVGGTTGENEPPLGGIVIENVTIDGAGYEAKMGGGMFFENKADITLKNSTIRNGSAKMGGGGAFYAGPHGSAYGPTITIEKCTFEGNTATPADTSGAISGGAILGYYAKITITDSVFKNNRAPTGGAISLYGDGARLDVKGASSFEGNDARLSGGAVNVFYGSNKIAGRGTPFRTTKDIEATIVATFSGNTAGASGTGDYVFSVYYDPATHTEKIDPGLTSRLKVNGSVIPATFFGDEQHSVPATFIPVSTYDDLHKALGYTRFNGQSFDVDPASNHPIPTYGSAKDGDIICLTGDLSSQSTNPGALTTDDITGATIYINKNVTIFGNGHRIDGKGFPVFDIEGTAADEPEVRASVSGLTVENGGYNFKLGGAVFVEGNSLFSVYNSTFANNTAGRTGDAVNGGGGAIYLNPHGGGVPKVNAVNSTFTGNKAPRGTGGAISATNGEITVSGSAFRNNEAAAGGAIGAMGTGKLNVGAGNTFASNAAATAGGAIDIHYGRSAAGRGTANSTVETVFTGVSAFEGNTAQWGDKVTWSRHYDADFPDDKSEPKITWPEDGSLNSTILTDLTFSDIDRTTLASGGGGSAGGGCNAGFGSIAALMVGLVTKGAKKTQM
ncbi:MAG: hypothetical protein LBT65_06230 [Synergistaceae bacterium]|jgi:hypothetical protein|nr:hypothetical protein [Synergistaceae bacterium]